MDKYLYGGAKALSGVLMMWFFLGSLYLFRKPLFLTDFTTGILCLLGLILIGTLFFSNKVLFMENGRVYQGLIFREKIFLKKEINLKNRKSVNVYYNKNQVAIPWWISTTANLFTYENAYKLKLETNTGKEKYLISFQSIDSKNKAVGFFKNNTKLEIKNCGNNN
ncbi:MAG: hypothetical protein AAF554_01970 [Bacteroidota bacterium]